MSDCLVWTRQGTRKADRLSRSSSDFRWRAACRTGSGELDGGLVRAGKPAVEPSLGIRPVSAHRALGDPKVLCYLFGAEAGEEPKLDDMRLLRTLPGEFFQGFVERQDLEPGLLDGRAEFCVEGDVGCASTSLHPIPTTSMVDEDPTDGLGSDGEEMSAILPVRPLLVDQSHPGFVDQGSGLECVPLALRVQLEGAAVQVLIGLERNGPAARVVHPGRPQTWRCRRNVECVAP